MVLKSYIQSILFSLLIGVILTTAVYAAGAVKDDLQIAVLTSHTAAPFDEAIQGFKQHLQESGIRVECSVFPLDSDPGKVSSAINEIKNYKPDLILALGSLAAKAAADNLSDIPIVAGMILSADVVKKNNVTGVFLEYSLETQFDFLHLLLPQVKTVGVIYNVQENGEKVDRAEALARDMGLTIYRQPIQTPREIPAALENISTKAEALWAIPDNIVYTPQTVKNILLCSYRNRIPFIGLSSSWVKAGALYALDWNYTDVGETCGARALTILQGKQADAGSPPPLKRVSYALNLKAAEHMKLEIPAKVIREASQVY